MKKFKTLILNKYNLTKEVIEVKGYDINDRLFAYKQEDTGKYCLIDKLTGLSIHNFDKLKELKREYTVYLERLYNLISKQEDFYNSKVEEFNNLKGETNETN